MYHVYVTTFIYCETELYNLSLNGIHLIVAHVLALLLFGYFNLHL